MRNYLNMKESPVCQEPLTEEYGRLLRGRVFLSIFNPFDWFDFAFNCQHDFDDTEKVSTEYFEDHRHSDEEVVYTETKRECKCGKFVYDCGLQYRKEDWINSK